LESSRRGRGPGVPGKDDHSLPDSDRPHSGKYRRSFTKLGKHGKQGELVIEWDHNIDDSEDSDEHEIGGQG
jgi:hypothetical protein